MPTKLSLSPSRQGAWIVNASKHLLSVARITDPGLSSLDNIMFAGKCGSLLIKLSADQTEQLSAARVKAHARLCGISGPELAIFLGSLKSLGCLDYDKQGSRYEVLALTRQRVLEQTSQVFQVNMPTGVELSILPLLEYCLQRPRLALEIQDFLSRYVNEKDAKHVVNLVRTFELLGTTDLGGANNLLFFNGYQFGERAGDIGKAIKALSREEKQQLDDLLGEVAKRPGLPLSSTKADEKIKNLAIGLGLLETSEVLSPAGPATFLMAPRFAAPSVGKETAHLEDDVFHHAKMLLASLRYGELRSPWSRGRISDPSVLISALIDRGQIGPCTAIGEDYVLLEGEGVIKTVPSRTKPGRFYMEIRRKEPAEMVLGLFNKGGSSDQIDAHSLPRSLMLPNGFEGPEPHRVAAFQAAQNQTPELMKRFLEALRT